jgi:uncharacterized membrane protein
MTQETETQITPPQGVAPRAGMRGWVRALFVASVTLNLLVAGVVIGGIIGHERHPPRPQVSDVSFGPFTEALSREDREALRKSAEAEGQSFRQMRRDASADFTRLVDALDAEPWDAAAARVALEGHRARVLGQIEIGERLMFERLLQMTPEARHAFADRLRRSLMRTDRKLPPPPPGAKP